MIRFFVIIFITVTFISFVKPLYGQDTSVSWVRNIDTVQFKNFYHKKLIPKQLVQYLTDKGLKDIANPGEKYRSGCVGPRSLPAYRLNWIAKDKHNHLIISIASGGWAHGTLFYCIDKEKGRININEIILEHQSTNWTLTEVASALRKRQFVFETYRK